MSEGPTMTERTRLHLSVGWWSLLFFLSLGIGLEALHGFKVGWYLDVDQEVRRLMFTLAHAHGALLALVHVAFAATLHIARPGGWAVVFASRSLVIAGVLLPAGFLLGGFGISGGDPGPGIIFVPLGALALVFAVALAAYSVRGARR